MSTFFTQIIKGSKAIWVIYAFLCILSCTVTFSAMSKLALEGASVSAPLLRHILFLCFGAAVILVIQIVDFRFIRLLSFPYMLFAVGMLVYVSITGGSVNADNASRFTALGQPSEYVKLGLILLIPELVLVVRKRDPFPTRFFYICMIVVGCILLLIFLENLSSAIIIASIVIVMLLAGGVGVWRVAKMVLLAAVFVACVIGFAFAVPAEKFEVMAKDYKVLKVIGRAYTWRGRLERFDDKEKDANDERIVVTDMNRQEVYAKVAVCRGGWLPSGPGSSLQRNYLPEAFSDYVFAIAAEEGGFILGMLIALAYLAIFVVSLFYIYKEQKIYRKLILLGCAFSITFQAAVHIAVSVGAMPVTGQTLPLVSRGGASLIVVSVMFGLIIKITATSSELTATFNPEETPAPLEPVTEPLDAPSDIETSTLPEKEEPHVDTQKVVVDEDPIIIVNDGTTPEPSPDKPLDDDDSIIIIE
ncbi:MAG: FtsW/RodA/SpoVE family cell cycle protein [Paludibacteraceae bacterium]|nr:FtsW/RodA/SpoVE family cell cycle protein [Paludibacteraceae bacterium]